MRLLATLGIAACAALALPATASTGGEIVIRGADSGSSLEVGVSGREGVRPRLSGTRPAAGMQGDQPWHRRRMPAGGSRWSRSRHGSVGRLRPGRRATCRCPSPPTSAPARTSSSATASPTPATPEGLPTQPLRRRRRQRRLHHRQPRTATASAAPATTTARPAPAATAAGAAPGDDVCCMGAGEDGCHGDAGNDRLYGGPAPTSSTAAPATTTATAGPGVASRTPASAARGTDAGGLFPSLVLG